MPFIQAITDTPIPTSVVPVKAVFTGVEDPEAHLTTFHTQMMLSGGSDAVYAICVSWRGPPFKRFSCRKCSNRG